MRFRKTFYLTGSLMIASLYSGNGAFSQLNQVPKAQIVLFTPSDVEPPSKDSYLPRLDQFGRYAEQFFHDGLKEWDYEPKRKEIFERDAQGQISVIHVQGELAAAGGAYKQQWLSRQALGLLRKKHGTNTRGNLYWIFVYVGDPPKKHDNYRGAGNSKTGGWAVLNYTNIPGEVSLKRDPVSRFHNKLFLKGCIHEFGHALGLPHIGPKIELRKGNTLMGPVTRIYNKFRQPNPTRAYLSDASAAMISKHPVFTGSAKDRGKLPATSFLNIRKSYNKKTKSVDLTGTLKANYEAHRIVVIDDRDDKPGAYWVKGYVAVTQKDGSFKFSIPRPKFCKGKFKLMAVYKNGAVTGDGKKHGEQSAKIIDYAFR